MIRQIRWVPEEKERVKERMKDRHKSKIDGYIDRQKIENHGQTVTNTNREQFTICMFKNRLCEHRSEVDVSGLECAKLSTKLKQSRDNEVIIMHHTESRDN